MDELPPELQAKIYEYLGTRDKMALNKTCSNLRGMTEWTYKDLLKNGYRQSLKNALDADNLCLAEYILSQGTDDEKNGVNDIFMYAKSKEMIDLLVMYLMFPIEYASEVEIELLLYLLTKIEVNEGDRFKLIQDSLFRCIDVNECLLFEELFNQGIVSIEDVKENENEFFKILYSSDNIVKPLLFLKAQGFDDFSQGGKYTLIWNLLAENLPLAKEIVYNVMDSTFDREGLLLKIVNLGLVEDALDIIQNEEIDFRKNDYELLKAMISPYDTEASEESAIDYIDALYLDHDLDADDVRVIKPLAEEFLTDDLINVLDEIENGTYERREALFKEDRSSDEDE